MTDAFAFIPHWALQLLHWLAGIVVLAESLNKLQRTAPFTSGLSSKARIALCLKALAWLLLALGGAGALVTPLMRLEPATLQDVCVIVGFAVLIIRTRMKEG